MISRSHIIRTLVAVCVLSTQALYAADVPVFITIGQSNADGSAYFDADEDQRLKTWYESDANSHHMFIWYHSTEVRNQSANALGEASRWVIDGKEEDVAPGWLELWYRNENSEGRTAMNMIHSYGTYSTGIDTNCAQGRRGMEGQFGMRWATAFPDDELYVLKLGVSGSFISSWADSRDDTNWNYFYDNIFRPGIESILARGDRPVLAGVWWMQGCADASKTTDYYMTHLEEIVRRVREDLGFDDATVYVGYIVKPGENKECPSASVQFGQSVRDAQNAVAAADLRHVKIIDTRSFPIQSDNLHFNHKGVNAIGDVLADRVIANRSGWAVFHTPGRWECIEGQDVFLPALGAPAVSYECADGAVTAVIEYPGFTDRRTR